MANNYEQVTVGQYLKLTDIQVLYAELCGYSRADAGDGLSYLYSEDGCNDEPDQAEWEFDLLESELSYENNQEMPYSSFYDMLESTLEASNLEYITVQGAYTCSKMRQDEFGGFAYYITKEGYDYTSTNSWIHSKVNELPRTHKCTK